jgi:folate-dependent phosphoribosylglycinamide formyltransferase PurN
VKKIAVFASGSGSNADKIINRFPKNNSAIAEVALIVCNPEQVF